MILVNTVIGVLLILGGISLVLNRTNPSRSDLWLTVLFLYLIELVRTLPALPLVK